MRLRSARLVCALAEPPGLGQCAVQFERRLSNWDGYTACSPHQALVSAHRCRGDHGLQPGARSLGRPRAGLDCASSRQRSNVPAPMPTSRATTSSAAPSDDSNVLPLSLNACPYRATSVLYRRPRFLVLLGATTILTRGLLAASSMAAVIPPGGGCRSSTLQCGIADPDLVCHLIHRRAPHSAS